MDTLATVQLGMATFVLRTARIDDVATIVELLADDQLGAVRDGEPGAEMQPYRDAFGAIDADPAQLLVVLTTPDDTVVGTMQLSFIPGLARRGTVRAQIEAVRVDRRCRSQGLGGAMVKWAIEEARRQGCGLVQLTSDKRRLDAHRFYDQLGFVASHVGYKLDL